MIFLLIVCQFCIINLHYQIWLTHSKVSSIYDCECSRFHSVAVQKSDSRCFFIADVLKLSKAVKWFIILWQIMHKILDNFFNNWSQLYKMISYIKLLIVFDFFESKQINYLFLNLVLNTFDNRDLKSSL